MSALVTFLTALAVAASAIAQILTDPRITWRFIGKTMVLFGVYAVHVGVGFLVTFFLLPSGPKAATGVTAAFLGWVGLGGLGLMR